MNFLVNFYHLFLESAPWLIMGLAVAGVLKVFIPMDWMNKQLGGHDIKTTVKAAFIGAPLPLCSCGVIPAAIGLRRAGASKAATTSFLVSTPETGIDSISVSYVLLGPFMTIVRPIAAITSAIVAGLVVGKDERADNSAQPEQNKSSDCCSTKSEPKPKPTSSCCSSKTPTPKMPGVLTKLGQGIVYSSTKLVNDITLWLLVGLGFAALVQTYIPAGFMTQWGTGIWAMLAMVIISIPMYICATASTPIAAGFLLAGVSPGAILVFMLAGPATNIATLGVVKTELGMKALYGYLTGVIGGALVFGYLVDVMVSQFSISVVPQIGEHHQLLPHWLTLSSGGLLAVLMLLSIVKSITNIKLPIAKQA